MFHVFETFFLLSKSPTVNIYAKIMKIVKPQSPEKKVWEVLKQWPLSFIVLLLQRNFFLAMEDLEIGYTATRKIIQKFYNELLCKKSGVGLLLNCFIKVINESNNRMLYQERGLCVRVCGGGGEFKRHYAYLRLSTFIS